jgi:hypothetical protein
MTSSVSSYFSRQTDKQAVRDQARSCWRPPPAPIGSEESSDAALNEITVWELFAAEKPHRK